MLAGISLIPAALRQLLRPDRPRWDGAIGTALAKACERAGPAAIKIAQFISARRDLLPEAMLAELAKLQDQVASLPPKTVERLLGLEFGAPETWPFRLDSLSSIAAGSAAVVLRAKLDASRNIAIKLIRPGVAEATAIDLQLLRSGARWLCHLPQLSHWPLLEGLDRLSEPILRQFDMRTEAQSIERLSASLSPGVLLPRVYHELCTANVLVMEYCPADFRITDPSLSADTFRSASEALLTSLYRMIFRDGFVHCDLHPGNVGCQIDTTVVLYDCGICAELDRDTRLNLIDLFGAVVDHNAEKAAWALRQSGTCLDVDLNQTVLVGEMRTLLARWSGRPAGEFSVAAFVRELFDIQRNHGIKGAPGFTSAILALVGFEGLVRTGHPELDFQAQARPYLTSGVIVTLLGNR